MTDRQYIQTNLDRLHTTPLGVERIARNLGLRCVDNDVIGFIRGVLSSDKAIICHRGKNIYVDGDGCRITVNASSLSVITAHRLKLRSKNFVLMTEKEKMLQGMIYDANYDPSLIAERLECKELCYDYNHLRPKEMKERTRLLHRILGSIAGDILIEQPFVCDYGYNIHVGRNFYSNHNLVILDGAKVTFGDNVFIAPNCGFYTAGHPLEAEERNKGLEYARPITVGSDVWIGGNVCVMPGVTIGNNCVIGAGSVVTKDIPDNSVAVGNPCRVIKTIERSISQKS